MAAHEGLEGLAPRLAGKLEQARRRPPVAVSPGCPVSQVVLASIDRCLRALAEEDTGVRLGRDEEAVHKARVATRRARSDLKTFRPLLDPAWARDARGELKWLGGRLGAVRDADVLAARLAARGRGLSPVEAPALRALLEVLEQERQEALAALRSSLVSERYLDLLARLDDALVDPPFLGSESDRSSDGRPARGRPLRRSAVRAGTAAEVGLAPLVRHPWGKLERAVSELGAVPGDVELHGIRILAKEVRYASEAASSVVRPAKALAKGARELQDVLGAHQDCVTAAAWLRRTAAEASPTVALAAGLCLAPEEAELRQGPEWIAVWQRLSRKKHRRWLS